MLNIPRELFDEMLEHAREEAPNECVGLLGSRNGTAVKLYRATNAAASPLRFEIDGSEQIGYHNDIEESGLELGAIYHSHTRTAPKPSQTDISFAAGWPGVLWVIVGLASPEPEVRTWRIEGAQVDEAELVVE